MIDRLLSQDRDINSVINLTGMYVAQGADWGWGWGVGVGVVFLQQTFFLINIQKIMLE